MKLRINEKENYYTFYQLHGGEPVVYGNLLLFRDGWTYSRNSYAGPAFPPPQDMRNLITKYWTIRKKALTEEHARLFNVFDAARKMAESTRQDVALEAYIVERDEQGTRKTWSPISISEVQEKLNTLKAEIAECERNLHVST